MRIILRIIFLQSGRISIHRANESVLDTNKTSSAFFQKELAGCTATARPAGVCLPCLRSRGVRALGAAPDSETATSEKKKGSACSSDGGRHKSSSRLG